MVGVKPSGSGELNHQTLPGLRQDTRLLEHFAIAAAVCAHEHRQLVRQLPDRREVRDGRFFPKVQDHEESSLESVELSEVREDVGVGVDEAEPPAVKRQLRLTQGAQETVLRQNGAPVCFLDLGEREWQEGGGGSQAASGQMFLPS